jgi:hypothetical protein
VRKKSLTLSHIPGGIVFPDGPNGTVEIPPDTIHIGGLTDIHVRGTDLDTATLTLDVASDDTPIMQGLELDVIPGAGPPAFAVELGPDLVLGTNYQADDATYAALAAAKEFQYTLQILEGAAAGSYRVLDVNQTNGAAPILWLDPEPPNASGLFRWRLLDELDINLVEPKETRVAGADGSIIQNVDLFSTVSGVDFDELGVAADDILRVTSGGDASDYVITEVLSPFFTQVRVDRPFTSTATGVQYSIFRNNAGGGVLRPLIRITSIDILDTNGQPIGTKIPYAKPVDVLSGQFSNPGVGVKASAVDAILGMVSTADPGDYAFGAGGNLFITWDGLASPLNIALTGTMPIEDVIDAINTASQSAVNLDLAVQLDYNSQSYIGFTPLGANTRTTGASTASVLLTLFGYSTQEFSSRDVRSSSIQSSGWPVIDSDLDSLWVVDGVQSGFYSDLELVLLSGVAYKLEVSSDFAPELARSIKVGSRSLGTARVYFLEPTSAEIDQNTMFAFTTSDGAVVNFKPEPTLGHQRIPALPNAEKPEDGQSVGMASTFTSSSSDFIRKGIRPGDQLIIDFVPVMGTVNLADPVPSLALKDFIISLQDQVDKKITFINDVGVANAVSRDGVAEQINAAVGLEVCEIYEFSAGLFRLRFNPDMQLRIRQQNGSGTEANTALGFSNVADTDNNSDHAGTYDITVVGVTTLTIDGIFPVVGTISDQQFMVMRTGAQRISTSDMADQVAEASLYYWDVELVSEGTGDLWNIASESPMVVTGLRSDGYYLSTSEETLSFSPAEVLSLHISRSILSEGVDDDPENAIQISGQSLSIAYERSQLVENLQSFVTSDVERVVNENPLARYLSPHFVRVDITYSGGRKESDIKPDMEQQIKDVRPDEALASSSLQKTLTDRGATLITNPLDLVAVVHNFDRTVTLARSQNALTTGRLAAFIPDIVNLTRQSG